MPSTDTHNETTSDARPKQRWLRFVGAGFLLLASLILLYGGIAYVAIQKGNELRNQRMLAENNSEISKQLALAEQDIADTHYERALLRLNWVLSTPRAQDFTEQALTLHTEAQTGYNALLTPSPTPTLTPTPPPTNTPTITPTPEPIAGIQALQDLVDEEAWAEAIPAIIAFQQANPSYQRQRTNELLFEAYMTYGTALLYGEEIERGLFYLRQAETLGPLSQEVLDQQFWANLYLSGIAFYGVDWGIAISYLADLCLVAPNFQDACTKLNRAREAYGDQFAEALDWCPAEAHYTDAWRAQRDNQELNDKRIEASQQCLTATPTPTITPTLPVIPTETPTPTP